MLVGYKWITHSGMVAKASQESQPCHPVDQLRFHIGTKDEFGCPVGGYIFLDRVTGRADAYTSGYCSSPISRERWNLWELDRSLLFPRSQTVVEQEGDILWNCAVNRIASLVV